MKRGIIWFSGLILLKIKILIADCHDCHDYNKSVAIKTSKKRRKIHVELVCNTTAFGIQAEIFSAENALLLRSRTDGRRVD